MTTSPSIARCSAPQSVVMAAPYRRRPTDTLWPTLRLVSRCVGVNWRAQGGDLRQRLLRPLRWLDTLPFGGHAREVTLEPGRRTDDQLMSWGTAEVGIGVRYAAGREGQLPCAYREVLVTDLEDEFARHDIEGLVKVV